MRNVGDLVLTVSLLICDSLLEGRHCTPTPNHYFHTLIAEFHTHNFSGVQKAEFDAFPDMILAQCKNECASLVIALVYTSHHLWVPTCHPKANPRIYQTASPLKEQTLCWCRSSDGNCLLLHLAARTRHDQDRRSFSRLRSVPCIFEGQDVFLGVSALISRSFT